MKSEAARSRDEIVDEVSKWGVGGGIITMALFPMALPFLILTLVALLPLAVPLLALGLVAGAIALPLMLIRKLGRSLRGTGPERRRAERSSKPAVGH